MITTYKYQAPTSRRELLGILAESGEGARLLAGGTDLLVDIRNGVTRPEVVVNLKKVPGFEDLTWSDAEGLRIGPATTVNALIEDGTVQERYPLLVSCAKTLASYQIRNRATVIGNIVNASPCADMAPGLLCLGARAVLSSRKGQREVPLSEFFTGVKHSVLQPDEMVELIIVPAGTANSRGDYQKLTRIQGHDLSLVGVAVLRHDGALRVGISSASPTPLLLDGFSMADPADEIAAACARAISPISDVRAGKDYRQFMAEVYLRRLLHEVQSCG